MTFTGRVKEEIINTDANPIEAISELAAFIRFDAKIYQGVITLVIENAGIARRIYKFIKGIYGVNVNIIVRTQKRFRVHQIYILEIKEKYNFILETLNIEENGKRILPNDYLLESDEEKKAFIRGLFLSDGSITDPKNGSYHMEFTVRTSSDAIFVKNLLAYFEADARILKRVKNYMIYIKSAETISEFIKMFGAVNSLFYFEDIRIYRDHKNMVNRLNNCEIANQEKSIKNGLKQIKDIEYLKQNNLTSLLDVRTNLIIDYRLKYPETSYLELAEIISRETEKKIGKSGINHAFIKVRELIRNHEDKEEIL